MKRVVCMAGVMILMLNSFSQQALYVTSDKTSSLVFPYPVIHIDRGTRDILVQAIPGSQSIILIKAACRDFHPTNLTVLTNDGNIYTFTVSYDSLPAALINKISLPVAASTETYANGILDNAPVVRNVKDESWDVSGRLDGIYIKDNVIYCQLRFINSSSIDYDFELLRVYLRDKRKTKRTATQEVELKPLYIAGNDKIIKAYSTTTLVLAVEKFTIPDAKFLAIEAQEKNGGRHLQLKVNNRKIIKARILPGLY